MPYNNNLTGSKVIHGRILNHYGSMGTLPNNQESKLAEKESNREKNHKARSLVRRIADQKKQREQILKNKRDEESQRLI